MDFDSLRAEERLLHVWRWLVDAESNLRSSRRQLDKLRDLRSEEMEVRKTLITKLVPVMCRSWSVRKMLRNIFKVQ